MLDYDLHWKTVGSGSTTYQPAEDDENSHLRVKVTYDDEHGADKVVYARTDRTVRAVPELDAADVAPRNLESNGNDIPAFDTDPAITREVDENVKVGTHVGNPVIAADYDKVFLTYTLTQTAPQPTTEAPARFKIDAMTGQITGCIELRAPT